MEKELLLTIKKRLEELYAEWYRANRCKDLRSRNKRIREACTAISNYAGTLPSEVLGLFDSKVARAALSPQFAGDDILPCIQVLEEKIKELA